MGLGDFANKIKACLEKTKKSTNNTYEITPFQVKMLLLQNGYPSDYMNYLDDYSIDLSSFSVYYYQLKQKKDKPVTLESVFQIYTAGEKKAITSDEAWNRMIETILTHLD